MLSKAVVRDDDWIAKAEAAEILTDCVDVADDERRETHRLR